MNNYKVEFDSIEWTSPAAGVRYKAFEHGGRKLRLVEFARDFVEADWCTKGHIGYLLKGRMQVDFSGTVVEFKAGDGIFIPAGPEHKHKAKVLTDIALVVLAEDSA